MLEAPGWPAAAASLSLVALALVLTWRMGLGLGRDIVVACARAALQLLAVGVVFAAIFTSSRAGWWAWAWVAAMVIVAWRVVLRRASHRLPGLGLAAAVAVGGSTAISLAVVFGFGVIDRDPVAMVVVAGITIGNAMPTAVLGLNRSIDACRERRGEIEALVSLGFSRQGVIRFIAPAAARTALVPQIERTKVVGIIALPGAMTGLLLAGVDPVDAVVVQLLVMYLILGSAAACVITVVTTVVRAAVTPTLTVADWVQPAVT